MRASGAKITWRVLAYTDGKMEEYSMESTLMIRNKGTEYMSGKMHESIRDTG